MGYLDTVFNREIPHGLVFSKTIDGLYRRRVEPYRLPISNVNRFTFLDWQLVPVERYSVVCGELQESRIEIPGMNGDLDISESLTGYPVYKNIEGEMEFIILHDEYGYRFNIDQNYKEEKRVHQDWTQRYTDMKRFLHGQTLYMMFEDDSSFYYKGRFYLDKYDSSEQNYSKITIRYNLYPYKRVARLEGIASGTNLWYWDALNVSGYPEEENKQVGVNYYENDYSDNLGNTPKSLFKTTFNINVDTDTYTELYKIMSGEDWPVQDLTFIGPLYCGMEPQIPEFEVEESGQGHISVEFINTKLGIEYIGENAIELKDIFDPESTNFKVKDRRIVLSSFGTPSGEQPGRAVFPNPGGSTDTYGSYLIDSWMRIKGHGTVSINFEIGVL